VPWCKFFVPKIASPRVKPGDPEVNNYIMYAKCVKGHVLKNADDWVLCENLPAPDSACWQEGGETIFSLMYKKRAGLATAASDDTQESEETTATQRATS
jgi:hypothetical protein